jgi:hypothetical protein
LNTKEAKTSVIDTQQAATIASLWATLIDEADSDNEAKVFLLMFGPWANDQLQQTPKS